MLTKKDFNGPEFQSWAIQQYEEIRVKANSRGKFKPDQYDRVELSLDKLFERFYKTIT